MMRIETIMVGQMGTNCYLAWDEESKRGFLVDPGEQADKINQIFRTLAKNGKAVLLATHDENAAASCDEHYVLENGKLR